MAKYYGQIGFVKTVETSPGVWEEQPTERYYYGDVMRNSMRWQAAEGLNDNIDINNRISIVADDYAYNSVHTMRYIVWNGVVWKILNAEVRYPRLILTLGGVYNGVRPNSV